MSFYLADVVVWSSQAQGSHRTKAGVVVEVVPAGKRPDRDKFPHLYKHAGVGAPRNHESYVVMVKRTPFWPRVKNLKSGNGLARATVAANNSQVSTLMDIDGKLVILRGPAGKLASPDAPNTGTWGGLGAGWRGVIWADPHSPATVTHHRAVKLTYGRYTFTSATNGLLGCDATKHSGDLTQQCYYKPDGNPDAGGYETWRVYDGNESGAIEAQIEYDNSEGKYFGYPLAVEVVE